MASDPTAWVQAVIDAKSWYERNIHEYNQGGYTDTSGTLNVGKVRHDCSGFVSACLRKAGFVETSFLSSSARLLENADHGKVLKSLGFVPIKYDLSKAKPFDILVLNGHTEIYAGVVNGSHKSYSWGNRHDLVKGGMPSATYPKDKFTVMWRLPNVDGSNIPPDVEYPESYGNGDYNGSSSNSGNSASTSRMASNITNSPNTVYQLASAGERKDVLKVSDDRKNQFKSLRDTLKSGMLDMGRTMIESPEMYNSSILKTSQSAKVERSGQKQTSSTEQKSSDGTTGTQNTQTQSV